jgi:hypothetical protein
LSRHGHAEGDEHALSIADIGLKPSKPQLLQEDVWVREQTAALRAELQGKLSEAWIGRYCSPSPGSRAVTGDQVQKCRRDRNAGSFAFVNDWYLKTFGIGVTEAEGMLGPLSK